MEQLPSALLQVILAKVPAPDCASAASVVRAWKQVAYQESLWESHCRSDLPLLHGAQLDPLDRPCASWKAAYESWASLCLFQRSKLCWDSLRSWTERNFLEVATSLIPGASLEELAGAESVLNAASRLIVVPSW